MRSRWRLQQIIIALERQIGWRATRSLFYSRRRTSSTLLRTTRTSKYSTGLLQAGRTCRKKSSTSSRPAQWVGGRGDALTPANHGTLRVGVSYARPRRCSHPSKSWNTPSRSLLRSSSPRWQLRDSRI
ncbi:hypothetical protein Ctob_008042 [Chrysochromulina tobinii]|uniref:Uncharacterized protein n=1 Tax=Chrysochromulina tobinii TaxID=1460289 RepID=A0A0M0K8H5_9EUKA|nr:hypothetical protein Ctob_008042 [Chrysochromulina tobinii]|eukprot:KOO34902.1 hypothetical protein Ctob_008042 [Chrysochromulina sp. CCMP291]